MPDVKESKQFIGSLIASACYHTVKTSHLRVGLYFSYSVLYTSYKLSSYSPIWVEEKKRKEKSSTKKEMLLILRK